MKEQAASLSFRRVLPIGQLLICAAALWPLRHFVLFQVSRSFGAYYPARTQQQESDPTFSIIEIPSLNPEQQQANDRAARMEDLRMTVAPMLNYPAGVVQLPYVIASPTRREWLPREMTFPMWRALSWPILGVFFWWLAGRGIDAFRAARKSIVLPRITIPETVFAGLFFGLGIAMLGGLLTSTPDDRGDVHFLALIAGGVLWAVLSGFSLAARYLQWRIGKRTAEPPLASD